LVVYLVFAARRDPIGRLSVGHDGRVYGDWSDGAEYWPEENLALCLIPWLVATHQRRRFDLNDGSAL